MFTLKSKSPVAVKLEELLLQHKMTPTDLARALDVPQSTIFNILNGHTEYPTGRTLVIIADYFNVSLDDLVDRKYIPVLQKKEPIEIPQANLSKIPVIDWADIVGWAKLGGINFIEKITEWVDYPDGGEKKAFALKINKTYLYRTFQRSGIVVIEPFKQFKDGDFVIASVGKQLPALFLMVEFSNDFWLESSVNKKPAHKFTENDVIYGVVARYSIDY